jgi:nucleoside-diphosphate-sugar epimerase
MINICITGGTGFVGRNLFRNLFNHHKYNISLVVRSEVKDKFVHENACEIYIDNNSSVGLSDFFAINKFDIVIHLATLYIKDHISDQIENLIQSNISFGTRLLEACSQNKVKKFINIGTTWQHYNNSLYSPVNLYAATKQAFESISRYYAEAHGICCITLKIPDTYGPGDNRPKIMNLWKDISADKVLEMSPGNQVIDLLYIDDVVNGITHLMCETLSGHMDNYCGESLLLSSGRLITLKELSVIFAQVSGNKLNINWGALPYRKREVMESVIFIKKLPNWNPGTSLEEGLKKLFNKDMM